MAELDGRTIADSVAALDAQLFVGREPEVAAFDAWLLSANPVAAILNVSGPGGVGKSKLLAEFGRRAAATGRLVRRVDGYGIAPEPEALMAALTGTDSVETGLEAINAGSCLVLIDTMEAIGELSQFFQDVFVPGLEHGVKLVVSGRNPLGRSWSGAIPWHRHVRHIELKALSTDSGRTYLDLRGITDAGLVADVLTATRGHPLALSMAADLIEVFGVTHFESAPGWQLALRGIVERLLRDVRMPELRELLEAAAVVRHFDESTLAAILAREDLGTAFDQLCRLSMIRAGERGLMLHESVRFLVADDLRWRNPDRWRELTLRRLAYHRDRARRVVRAEREWLVAEQLYLWGDTIGHHFLYGPEEPGVVWVTGGRAEYADELLGIWREWRTQVMVDEGPLVLDDSTLEEAGRFVRIVIEEPHARLQVARDVGGRLMGFTTVVPITQTTFKLVAPHPIVGPFTRAYVSEQEVARLPKRPEDAKIFHIMLLAYRAADAHSVRAALARDLVGLFARNGVYLVVPSPSWKTVFASLGFRQLDEARDSEWTGKLPPDGYVLDLTRLGVDRWIEAITSGGELPFSLRRADVERHLHDVLVAWADDGALSRSPLAEFLDADPASDGERAMTVRGAIRVALERSRATASPEMELSLRALEAAYLDRTVSHDRTAENLHVSRTTFYRLLQRGVRRLGSELVRPSSL